MTTQELLSKLDQSETELRETKLDLENERATRRRLQQDMQDNRELQEKQGRRPFAVTLIDADADGYVVRRAIQRLPKSVWTDSPELTSFTTGS